MVFTLQVLSTNASSSEAVDRIIDDALKQHCFMSDIYALGISEADVRAEVEKYRSQMTSFMTKHVLFHPERNRLADRYISCISYAGISVVSCLLSDIFSYVYFQQ